MQFTSIQLLAFLLDNPNVNAVWNHYDPKDDHFLVATSRINDALNLQLPPDKHQDLALRVQCDDFHPAKKISNVLDPENPHQKHQLPPYALGCQIQGEELPWLATAGIHAKWNNASGDPLEGFLTTWSAVSAGLAEIGHDVCHPTSTHPPIGHLTAFTQIDPQQPNTTDAALIQFNDYFNPADDPQIIGVGKQNATAVNAFYGMHAIKSGAGTRVQRSRCLGTNAAARVHYGQASAIFIGQDVYCDHETPFATFGDSGSGIFETKTNKPASLLFARGGPLTLGNPIQELIDKFKLIFDD